MTFTLIITKTEFTLNGINLDRNERMAHAINRMNKCANQDVVKHETTLLQKEFKTAKAAWVYATPELIDALGVTYQDNGTIGSDYCDYMVDVIRSDRIGQ